MSWLPIQVILVIKYWTLLCVGSIVLSLGAYVVMTGFTQSLWLFRISPKTFPFLCELPLCVWGGVARRVAGTPWCHLEGGSRGGEGGLSSPPPVCFYMVSSCRLQRAEPPRQPAGDYPQRDPEHTAGPGFSRSLQSRFQAAS